MGKFDASAFIAAERASCSGTVADSSSALDTFVGTDFSRDFRHFRATRMVSVATVAGVAAPSIDLTDWKVGLQRLEALPTPAWMTKIEWDEMVWEATRIGLDHAEAAIDLGWKVGDLFGCHPKPWCADGSRDGLVACISSLRSPVKLTAIHEDYAVLTATRGETMRYRPRPHQNQALIWEAMAQQQGP